MASVHVDLGTRSYDIAIGPGLLAEAGERLAGRHGGRFCFLVTDQNVGPLYADTVVRSLESVGMKAGIATIPAGESSKCLQEAGRLYDALLDALADRQSVVIALGGGVVGDLAGFVAATYARGIAFVQMPTSLLSMVDSSVGGKVGVDHARAKNMIGAFHQPSAVLCDVDALASLPDRQYRCGLAEVVKYGVIMAPSFFERIEASVDAINAKDTSMLAELVARSCRCKADVVEEDEFETKGRRAILNYGHTFAHAFEAASGYEELQHGEAVAIGMMCAARLASHLGMVEGSLEDRQRRLWAQLGLPTFVPSHLVGQDLIAIMRRDKKSVAGQLRFVLPTRLGSVETVGGVDERLVERVIEEMADRPGL